MASRRPGTSARISGPGATTERAPAINHSYLLVVRFALVNVVALALLGGVYLQGWLEVVLAADLIELSLAIVLVFLYGLASCTGRVWITGAELNDLKAGRPSAAPEEAPHTVPNLQSAATGLRAARVGPAPVRPRSLPYWAVDNAVGRSRVTCMASRSINWPTRGAISFFQ